MRGCPLAQSLIHYVVVFYYTAEGAMKARREIADYMKNRRSERARIRVCDRAASNFIFIIRS